MCTPRKSAAKTRTQAPPGPKSPAFRGFPHDDVLNPARLGLVALQPLLLYHLDEGQWRVSRRAADLRRAAHGSGPWPCRVLGEACRRGGGGRGL